MSLREPPGGTPTITARGQGGWFVYAVRGKEPVIVLTCDDAELAGRDSAIQDFVQTRILDQLAD